VELVAEEAGDTELTNREDMERGKDQVIDLS
jgi:hypothetical protein